MSGLYEVTVDVPPAANVADPAVCGMPYENPASPGERVTISCLEYGRHVYALLRSRGVDVDAAFRARGFDPEVLRQRNIVTGPMGIPERYYLYGGLGLAGLAVLHMLMKQ